MAITFEAYAKNNLCYKAAKKMPNGSPAGIIIHSTGCNNPNLWRYVDSPEICGKNLYGTHWNVPMPIGGNGKPTRICCHAFIGKDKDGAVVQLRSSLGLSAVGIAVMARKAATTIHRHTFR